KQRQLLASVVGIAVVAIVLVLSLTSASEREAQATEAGLADVDTAAIATGQRAEPKTTATPNTIAATRKSDTASAAAAAPGEADVATDYPQGCGQWIGAKKAGPQAQQGKSAWYSALKAIQAGDTAKAEEFLCLSVWMDSAGPGPVALVRFHLSQSNL